MRVRSPEWAVDVTHFLAGPHMTRCPAALGAEVIKVERPPAGEEGRTHPYHVDGQSRYHLQQNMGEKGLCVDLKDPRGLEAVRRLVDRSDVLVENFRPWVLDRLGLEYETLAARNPRLVYCSISSYGHAGPYAGKPSYGLLAEAASGVMDLVGVPDQRPPVMRRWRCARPSSTGSHRARPPHRHRPVRLHGRPPGPGSAPRRGRRLRWGLSSSSRPVRLHSDPARRLMDGRGEKRGGSGNPERHDQGESG
jgi:CoA-transferase family III